MLTGHEKPLTEYSNPFLMLTRKYDIPDRTVYQFANYLHPHDYETRSKHVDFGYILDFYTRLFTNLLNDRIIDFILDFNEIMGVLWKAHGKNFEARKDG